MTVRFSSVLQFLYVFSLVTSATPQLIRPTFTLFRSEQSVRGKAAQTTGPSLRANWNLSRAPIIPNRKLCPVL